MVKVTNAGIKLFLVKAIQDIEKTVGLAEIDSEEIIVNMALAYLFNSFDIGLALDTSEIITDRNKILSDLDEVRKFLENADLNEVEQFLEKSN